MNINDLEGLDLTNLTLEDIKELISKKKLYYNNEITISTDGACQGNPNGLSAGTFAIWDKESLLIEYKSNFYGNQTNNKSEAYTILKAVEYLKNSKYNSKSYRVLLISDSQLIINLINGSYKGKDKILILTTNNIRNIKNNLSCKLVFEHRKREDPKINFCDKENKIFLKNYK